ncbi:ABC transporter ATP-binding protein [Phototrophicus methaneseepsis]|uniref:ABC transporter ATP-binding protein n=1 Tax=Phototrophicus methaneseepsis TaxID=2710758 RepID=A0A7S8E5J8_9CHLR|nr:ABC transporter ATP-binding protein [Phototrophicus methaneseepsis]QPC80704.1 ABC transporter ATP-binding protein [Phototrophicus methaneseepsis]
MIEVTNLVKKYGNVAAVDGISFSANPGEIVGLLGPNGAGKTTTMRVLTGYMPVTSGTVKVDGFDVMEDSMQVRQRVGYMPEQVPIYPDMTVESYVLYWARLRRTQNAKARTQEVLTQFGLLDRRKKLVRSLSKGLRQRLGLAQALVHNPPVIILDEPTIGIDPKQVVEVRDVVKSLRSQHTILFSSHILSEVEQICDRVVIIDKGHIVAAGSTDILRQKYQHGVNFYVKFAGDTSELGEMLAALPGINSVEAHEGGFIVHGTDNDAIRHTLMNAVAANNLDLMEMRPVDTRLEDIFMQLVN